LPLLAALTLLASPDAGASGPKLEVDKADNPLLISTFLSEDATFNAAIRLHALDSMSRVRPLFSDLKSDADPTQDIPRSQLSLSGVDSLDKDDYVDAKITVAGVKVPGTYKGQVELLPDGVARKDAVKVAIELHALVHPVLNAVAPQDRVHGAFAHCGLTCASTSWLVPGSAGSKSQSISFSVGQQQKPVVTAIHVIGTGADEGHQLTSAELGLDPEDPSKNISQEGDVLSLHLKINPEDLPADHYTGTVRVSLQQADAPVTVPIDFTVRNEPLGAIIALIIGILLGRLTQHMQGRGGELLSAYKRASTLDGRVLQVSDPEQKQVLQEELARARAALDRDDLDLAKKLLDEIDTATSQGTSVGALAPTPQRSGPKVPRVVAWVSPVRSDLGLAAHVLGLVVFVSTLLVGFQTLYINQGTSFGSHGLFDLVGLVLWGLGADVASRGLGSLAGTSGTASAKAAT
jgi:hypothetical protein